MPQGRYSIDPSELEKINSICVLCWGLIGDVFMRVPVIEALHARFPQAEITVVVDPPSAIVLQHHPQVRRVVALCRRQRPLLGYLYNTVKTVYGLRKQRFDLSVNLYSGGSSPLITRLINAGIRLGFDHTRRLRKANNLLVKHPSFCQHWSKALGGILAPLGVPAERIRRGTSFYFPEEAAAYAGRIVGDESYVAINAGAGVAEKRWPVARFVALAEKIHAELGLKILVFTNPGMEELALEFQQLYGDAQSCLILPQTDLDKVGAVLARCVAVITGDTSIMHLSFGVKCPSLVLFTHTRPEVVEPEDVLHIPCFIEDHSRVNECNRYAGSVDIPVDFAFARFQELISLCRR